ncbi:MAG TPA: FHA domain-containing protein [Candidatus Solibacter sp.]|nr:FHA domain-containing protein [Candidatus Solibacter sp.]
MNLFAEIEKSIDRAFRSFTRQAFGAERSNDLVEIHHLILAEIDSKVQVLARGQRVFPFPQLEVTIVGETEKRREVLQAAFGERLQSDILSVLRGSRCEIPAGFTVALHVVETALQPIEIQYGTKKVAPKQEAAPPAPGRLVLLKGKSAAAEYTLEKPRTNIGRMAELTDASHRVIRRNDIVFEDDADEISATVSRKHARILLEEGEYRLCDDASEYGTSIFRDGASISVPKGARRGEKLRPGDEIYFGRACMRFER